MIKTFFYKALRASVLILSLCGSSAQAGQLDELVKAVIDSQSIEELAINKQNVMDYCGEQYRLCQVPQDQWCVILQGLRLAGSQEWGKKGDWLRLFATIDSVLTSHMSTILPITMGLPLHPLNTRRIRSGHASPFRLVGWLAESGKGLEQLKAEALAELRKLYCSLGEDGFSETPSHLRPAQGSGVARRLVYDENDAESSSEDAGPDRKG